MALPSYVVYLEFGASGLINVTQYVQSISINRGISRALDDYSAGSVSITFINNDRVFDPLNTSSPLWYGAGGYTVVQPAGRVLVSSNGIRRFTGFVQDWEFTYDESGFNGLATVSALDLLYKISNTAFTGGTQYEVEATSDRIKSVLGANSFGTADYAGIRGGLTLVGYDENSPGDNVLSYTQNVARSEPADYYASNLGVMQMKDRSFTNYSWNNTTRSNFITYPSTATILDNSESLTEGVNRSGWELIGTQATATASAYGGFVWLGGTVVDPFVPTDSYVGLVHVDYNPTRYANSGLTYTFAGLIRGVAGTFDISLITLDATGQSQNVASTTVVSASSTAWNAFTVTNTDSTTVGGLRAIATISGGTTYTVLGDGFIVEPAGTSVNYFDGDYNPYAYSSSASTAYQVAWAGVPRESQSGLITSVSTAVAAKAVQTFADVNSQGTAYGNGTGIPFTDLQVTYASEQLYNQVQVVGINATAVVSDTASQALYGVRDYSQTDNLTVSTSKPAEIASAFLGEFRLPEYRASQLTVGLEGLTSAEQSNVLRLELRDVVRVCFQPSAEGDVVDKYYYVLGVSSNTDVERDAVTFSLASLDNLPFRLDSPYLGVLDANTLA